MAAFRPRAARAFLRSGRFTARHLLVGLIAAGLVLRLAALFTGFTASDASAYAVMAQSFVRSGEFIMPLGEYFSDSWAPAYSHHYSPAYPMFLVPFIAIAGLSSFVVRAAAFVSGILLLFVAYLTTRNMYGPDKALLVTAVVAIDPVLIGTAAVGFSENFLTLFFVLTIWAILRSLNDRRYIVLAGLFAGIAYLTRGALGWFFLVAGIAGLVWRFHYLRWRVFRDVYYLAAIAIFGAFVGLWALRNLVRFWDGSAIGLLTAWQSSAYVGAATEAAFASPADLLFILVVRSPLYVGLFLSVGVWWLRDLRRKPVLSDEHYSGLWLAIGLIYLLAWIIAGILWVYERNPIFWLDQGRYVVMANVVILWLIVKDAPVYDRAFRRRYGVLVAVFLVAAVVFLVMPRPAAVAAYEALRERVGPGDVIAIDGLVRYEVLLNVGPELAYVKYEPGVDADFIIAVSLAKTFPGYVRVATRATGDPGLGFMLTSEVAVWERSPA